MPRPEPTSAKITTQSWKDEGFVRPPTVDSALLYIFPLDKLTTPCMQSRRSGASRRAIVIISVFFVMTYSCTREKRAAARGLGSAHQALTGNEWFVGKAQGFEPPEPAAPAPTPPPIQKPPIRVAKARPQPPKKRLGGKVFENNSREPTNSRSEELPEQYPTDDITSFELGHYPRTSSFRPEYYLERNVELPISDFEVKAGTTIPAQLDIGINSDLGGPAIAHITRTIYDTVSGEFALIPPGTKLFGSTDPNIPKRGGVWNPAPDEYTR